MEPVSVAEFNRKSNTPVFGQIVESRDPKENSNGTWNFHFILGKNGVLVQVWVFGSKDEIHSFADKIRVDEYFVFWGYTVKENKYSTNLTSTSEWGMVIPCNSTKFDRVKVTKIYQQPEPCYSEEQEVFSHTFRQAGPSRKLKKRERKKEHSYKEKKRLLDTSQKKITEYAVESNHLILNNSTDSLE